MKSLLELKHARELLNKADAVEVMGLRVAEMTPSELRIAIALLAAELDQYRERARRSAVDDPVVSTYPGRVKTDSVGDIVITLISMRPDGGEELFLGSHLHGAFAREIERITSTPKVPYTGQEILYRGRRIHRDPALPKHIAEWRDKNGKPLQQVIVNHPLVHATMPTHPPVGCDEEPPRLVLPDKCPECGGDSGEVVWNHTRTKASFVCRSCGKGCPLI